MIKLTIKTSVTPNTMLSTGHGDILLFVHDFNEAI